MKENAKISDAEMEVLKALWAAGEWESVAGVCGTLVARNWNYKTVGTFLLRLQGKGILESRKEGKLNLYRPLLTEEEYRRRETEEFLHTVHGGSMESLLASLFSGAADPEAVERLESWLKER